MTLWRSESQAWLNLELLFELIETVNQEESVNVKKLSKTKEKEKIKFRQMLIIVNSYEKRLIP